MVKLRNTPLREAYEDLRWLESLLDCDDDKARCAAEDWIEHKKHHIRRDSRKGVDRLAKPITEAWRCVNHRDGEGCTEARIFTGNWDDMTDEEIDFEMRQMEVHNYSPYDCSGKLCTAWLSWKRIPLGISVVHCYRLDI